MFVFFRKYRKKLTEAWKIRILFSRVQKLLHWLIHCLFLPLEKIIHISVPPWNILYIYGRFPFARSVQSSQSVLKWNAPWILRTGSEQNGPAHGSEPLSSPTPVGQSAGELWREKCTCTPWTFPFKLARTSSFRPARMNIWKVTYVYSIEPQCVQLIVELK